MRNEPSQTQTRLAALRVAVTGHRGFIGRHLTAALRSLKASFVPIEGDVRAAEAWADDFDILYHLAAAMPARFADAPAEGFSINVNGTLQALEACRAKGARMVFASTCGVYDPAAVGALSEGRPIAPQTPYAQSKWLGEGLCRTYAQHYGVPCTVYRLFNIYGPGQKPGFLIPYLIRCCLEGGTATVHNEGSSRDFLHVSDATEALLHATASSAPYAVFNIGSGQPCTVRQVIEMIGSAAGRPLCWNRGQGRPDLQPAVYASIASASETLGWSPVTGLEEGLRRAVRALSNGRD